MVFNLHKPCQNVKYHNEKRALTPPVKIGGHLGNLSVEYPCHQIKMSQPSISNITYIYLQEKNGFALFYGREGYPTSFGLWPERYKGCPR